MYSVKLISWLVFQNLRGKKHVFVWGEYFMFDKTIHDILKCKKMCLKIIFCTRLFCAYDITEAKGFDLASPSIRIMLHSIRRLVLSYGYFDGVLLCANTCPRVPESSS